MVLQKGCVAIGSELQGEKWVDPKPLLAAPTIMGLCEDIVQSHIWERDNERGASTWNLTVQQREGRGYRCHRTCTKRLKRACV
jgi:hypothetical protein